MRTFANSQDPDTKAALLAALDRGADMYQFNGITYSKGIQRAWRRHSDLGYSREAPPQERRDAIPRADC
jgi:hypothetical protein